MMWSGEGVTVEQVHQLRRSFALLERHPEVAALIFYQELFLMEPRLRTLFRDDISAQARKLMEMIGAVLGMLDEPGRLMAVLEELGCRHAGYGVVAGHYPIVRRALAAMLRQMLQDELTPCVLAAWSELYDVVEAAMLRGAAMGQDPRR